jgi:hypothetical protein
MGVLVFGTEDAFKGGIGYQSAMSSEMEIFDDREAQCVDRYIGLIEI